MHTLLPRLQCVPRRLAIAASTVLAGLALLAQPAIAQQSRGLAPAPHLQVKPVDRSASRKIDLSIGKSLVVTLPQDAKEVFVANPKVANAVVRSSRQLYVMGLADGYTSILVMDGEGQQIASLDVGVGRDLAELRQTFRSVMPRADIDVKPTGQSILLTGTVASAAEAAQAVDIASAFVGVTPGLFGSSSGRVVNSLTIRGRDQVMVKVVVAEISRTAIKQLGINSDGTWKVGNFSLTPQLDNPFPVQLQALSATAVGATIGANKLASGIPNFQLKALERAGLMRTLAEPNLTAISGESAKFTAGGEIPVPKSQQCALDPANPNRKVCDTSIDFKPYGVSLNFLPVVMSDGRISMRVATEVTEIDAEYPFRLEGQASNIPSFKIRRSDTTVELPSGASLVTAGLISRQTKQIVSGFPGLMNLPVLGALFRSRDYERRETELMIMATPYIVKPANTSEIQRPTDGFVEVDDAQGKLLGRMNQIYGGQGTAVPSTIKGRVGFITK
jgi:pilus assembly protein CpaC